MHFGDGRCEDVVEEEELAQVKMLGECDVLTLEDGGTIDLIIYKF